jgi:glutathione S-transferase
MAGIPTIIDHDNNDFALWESASIIRYLVARYDKDHKLSFPTDSNETFLVDQWMTFQASGQVSNSTFLQFRSHLRLPLI